jgi:phosphatidylserine decarboxylase
LLGRRNPFVAHEGIPFLAITIIVAISLIGYADPWYALLPGVAFIFLFLLFRDPVRTVPSVALGVVSPVDGEIIAVDKVASGELQSEAHRIVIRVDRLGSYTARSPVEGKIMDPGTNALWVQTDEGDDVVLQFRDYRFGLAPRSFARFGERLGQGQRCVYLRLARVAEVQLPITGKVLVEQGQVVIAGTDVIATVPRH